MKKTCSLLWVAVAVLASVTAVRAEVIDYKKTNTDYSTFQINDVNAPKGVALYQLFNKYFGLEGDKAYTSSMQLYQERGLKETMSWFSLDGAKVAPAFKYADFPHTLSLTDSLGNILQNDNGDPLLQLTYGSNMGKYDIDKTIVDLPGIGGYNWKLSTNGHSTDRYTDPSLNVLDIIRAATFDVTDLARSMFGMDIESAYMIAWEDNYDYDYKDLAYIVFDAKPSTTPEPASALIFGLGSVLAIPIVRRWKKKRNATTVSQE